MKDEAWLEKVKERLKDYSEPLPTSGWKRLERELPVPMRIKSKPRKIATAYRWGAAAAVLAAVSLIGLYLFDTTTVNEEMFQHHDVPSYAAVMDEFPAGEATAQQITPEHESLQNEVLTLPQPSYSGAVDEKISTPVTDEDEYEVSETDEDEIDEAGDEFSSQEIPVEKNMPKENTNENDRRKKTVKKKKTTLDSPESLLAVADVPRSKSKGWTLGLSVGNTGGFNSIDESTDISTEASQYLTSSSLSLLSSNGVVVIPEGHELVFRNGMPYLMQDDDYSVASARHRQPVSVGLSVRKNLPKGFSIETGLTYTYLSSDILFEGEIEEVSQKLHYMGIPIRANWNFFDSKLFTLYVSGGGAMEKCVYGKLADKKETVKQLQFSIMTALGAQYNLSRHIGIYFEPGFSYYFDDGSDIETIRKENPSSFTLQAGLRFSY